MSKNRRLSLKNNAVIATTKEEQKPTLLDMFRTVDASRYVGTNDIKKLTDIDDKKLTNTQAPDQSPNDNTHFSLLLILLPPMKMVSNLVSLS
jgi:hypothetical protein